MKHTELHISEMCCIRLWKWKKLNCFRVFIPCDFFFLIVIYQNKLGYVSGIKKTLNNCNYKNTNQGKIKIKNSTEIL